MRAEQRTDTDILVGGQPGAAGARGPGRPGEAALGLLGHRQRAPGIARGGPGAGVPNASANASGGGALVQRHATLRAAKRGIDLVCCVAGLILTAPLVAILAAAIRLDSRGPAFLRQTRVGRDGRPFDLFKLRTMHEGARVTRVGRILRPMGLDEIPQLWNVLAGDMSIVGPRPERPHLVAEYQAVLPGYAGRHFVRPGITGWAQIHGQRGNARPIAERLKFDLEYVRTWHPLKDLQILALTVVAVWRDTRRELGH
jgi:lipopolysaccharide/colanic/teichoic acid biosynthesis glycosyltransferase